MKRNVIPIFALISAISAGGAAQANQGYISGHHELPENTATQNSGLFSDGGVSHLNRYSDGTLIPKEGNDLHQGASNDREAFNDEAGARGPLPPEADVNR
jgi:hypothetical protein